MLEGLTVTELHTQDGYDWPNGVQDERWPAATAQPKAPYFREQLAQEASRLAQLSAVAPGCLPRPI